MRAAAGMDDPNNQTRADRTHFREVYENRGFWSSCGYDGLAVVFDLPLENFQSVPDDQKRALMRLLAHLAKAGDASMQDRIREFECLTVEKRLVGLLHLSTLLAARE
jgi:hypothetical protein